MDAVSAYNYQTNAPILKAATPGLPPQFVLPNWQQQKPADPKTAQTKAAKDFESVYISQMLAPMFDTVDTDPEFGGGESEKIYQSMMVQEYAKQITARGGMGLAKYIENDLAKKNNTTTTQTIGAK